MKWGALAFILVWLAGFYGWVANIVKLFAINFHDPISTILVLRCLGIVLAPLGALLGFVSN